MADNTPARLAAYQAAVEARKQATRDRVATARREILAGARALALSIECPVCHVAVEKPCDWGEGINMRPTHGLRYDVAGSTAPTPASMTKMWSY